MELVQGVAVNRSWLKPRAHDLAALAVLLALIAITLWIRLWRQPGLNDWDVMTYYLPMYAFLGEHVRHFSAPGWNPHLFSGTPFAANPQSGWSYLPAMAIFALFSPMTAFRIFIAFHMALGGVTTFVFARLLKVGAIGSLAAAVVFAFGQNLGASTCCTIHVQLDAWIPLALIGVELASTASAWRSRAFWLALSAVAVSQMIAGWVGQGTYYALLLIVAYLLFRSFRISKPWRERVTRLAASGFAIVLGGGLSAAGLLPRLEFAARTFVGTSEYQGQGFAADKGWDRSTVFQTLIGYQSDWRPYYAGSAALVCVAVTLLVLRRSRSALFFAAFTLVVIILPMRPTPLHQIFYLLPKFRGLHLHDPGRVLAILPIGVTMLAGFGIDALPRLLSRRRAWLVVAAPAIGWALLLLATDNDLEIVTGATWAIFGVAVLLLVLAGAWASGRFKPRLVRPERAILLAQSGLIVLLFLDPTGAALVRALKHSNVVEATYTQVSSPSVLDTQTSTNDPGGAGALLQARQAAGVPFRYFGFVSPPPGDTEWQLHEHYMDAGILPLLANNRAMRLGLDDIQGYDPAHLTIYRDFFIKLNNFKRDYHEELVYASGLDSPLLNLLNVRYVVVPLAQSGLDPSRWREVFRDNQTRVLENVNALPRVWIVHSARTAASNDDALNLLAASTVDPRTTAVLQETPPALAPAPTGSAESAEIADYSDDAITLSVHAASAGLVMLSEIYDPG